GWLWQQPEPRPEGFLSADRMIITSLLDTDLYKFSMMQAILHHFPAAQVEYRYKCHTPGADIARHIDEIRAEVHALCQLRITAAELEYLRSLRFIRNDFVDFPVLFHWPERCRRIERSARRGAIEITVKGAWLHTTLFEIPVLSIINEVYFRQAGRATAMDGARQRLDDKIHLVSSDPALADFRVADYGTRRRFSKQWHEEVVQRMIAHMDTHFAGTSNVFFAMKYGIRPLGTMGAEYLQACQGLGPRLRDSQIYAFETWAREYRGDLGIALTDVYGMDAFLRDFDMYFCKLFDGARHNVGDPIVWGERLLAHYQANRVDPRTKTLVFSDGLT